MSARVRANPLADALDGGVNRRRSAGERADGGPRGTRGPRTGERRIAVDVPADLYREAKLLAVRLDTTVKDVLVGGLRAEVERLTNDGR